jgi:GntR family transcriptional regulator/MocR family aminotransferase
VSTKPEETLFALGNDNVIYMNTFSLTVSPSLRVGYMVLPKSLLPVFEEKLGFYSCTVPTFEQFVLAELIGNGDFERHVNSVRRKKRAEQKR